MWASVEKFGGRVLTLLIFFILARLLDPKSFGLVAIVNSIIALASIFAEQGFVTALIQREHLEKRDIDSAFWGSLGMSLLLFAGVYVAAPGVAAFYAEPALTDLIRVISLSILIGAVTNVQSALLQRNLRFRGLAIRQLLATVAGGSVGISLAVLGYGVWALVLYLLVRAIALSALLMVRVGYHPGLAFSWARYASMFRFGVNVLGSKLLFYGNSDLINMLIGHFLGVEALGFFSIANRVYITFKDMMINTVSRVILPHLSRVQDQPERLRQTFLGVVEKVSAVTFPACLMLAAFSGDLIQLFFGPQWLPALPIMQLLVISAIFSLVSSYVNDLLLAIGQAFVSFQVNLLSSLLNLGFFFLFVWGGIEAVAWGFLLRNIIVAPVSVAFLPAWLQLPYLSMARALAKALLPGLLVFGALWAWPLLGQPAGTGYGDLAIRLVLALALLGGTFFWLQRPLWQAAWLGGRRLVSPLPKNHLEN